MQLWAQHDLVNEVDDGDRRLLRVHLREQVAHVLGGTSRPPRHKAKHPAGRAMGLSVNLPTFGPANSL